jgi:hypothetical protein
MVQASGSPALACRTGNCSLCAITSIFDQWNAPGEKRFRKIWKSTERRQENKFLIAGAFKWKRRLDYPSQPPFPRLRSPLR